MVRRSDNDGVNSLLFVEHLSVILVAFAIRVLLKGMSRVIPIHTAQGHNVLAVEFAQVGRALAANADSGNVEFTVWRELPRPAQNVPRQNHKSAESACRSQKVAPRDF